LKICGVVKEGLGMGGMGGRVEWVERDVCWVDLGLDSGSLNRVGIYRIVGVCDGIGGEVLIGVGIRII
jgi:hypothetical protein